MSRENETQIQYKMHFHKTIQDLPIYPNHNILYDIHKNFETVDASNLSVENIINTVFFNCEDKKYAQICAQTYICHRIISKASELKLKPLFYRDHSKFSQTLYEEPTYILIKSKIVDIARNILSHRHPVILLHRCSEPSRKRKTIRHKKQKKNYAFDKSLRSIVGKFPTLMIPKLSPTEIEYHLKYKIFDLEKNSLTMRKYKSLKKTKPTKKENFLQNSETRRSSRLKLRKEKMALNGQKNCQDNFSVVTERNLLKDSNSEQEEFKRFSTVHLRGNYIFEFVVKTQMDVTEDACEHLKDELGLDKDVIASLRELYKSVHNGKNNYIFCELSY